MQEYQVTFRVKGLVSLSVRAGDFDEALNIAKLEVERKEFGFFNAKLDTNDMNFDVVSVSNMDNWNID